MDEDQKKSKKESLPENPAVLFELIKSVQGLPDEIIKKFLAAKGVLVEKQNEQ